jgi:tetratricopeptide (TPR) repeat protein
VTVMDANINDYKRPGVIAKNVVDIINSYLDKLSVPMDDVPDAGCVPTNAVFMKDLQASLRVIAKNLGVNLLEGNFSGIENNTVQVDESESLSCDLLIDCTGERRKVVKSTEQFTIESIDDNPIKTHFIAFVTMDSNNAALAKIVDSLDPVPHTLAMEKLRMKFHWKEFAPPELVTGKWENIAPDQTRFYYYFELPENIAKGDQRTQIKWLKALLKLKTGNKIRFNLEEDDLKFVPFFVNPKKVMDPVNQSYSSFPIVACGDALMSADYRLGTGVQNGVLCANALLTSVTLDKANKIVVNSEKYKAHLQEPMGRHESKVKSLYSHKRAKLTGSDLFAAFRTYQLAYEQAESVENKEIIRNGLLHLAAKFKSEAGQLFAKKKFNEAGDYYQQSLKIYEGYHAESCWDDISKNYSNLAKIAYQNENYDLAIQLAERGLLVSTEHSTCMKDKLLETLDDIRSVKCSYLLTLAENKLKDKKDISEEITEASTILQKISSSSKNYSTLQQRVDKLVVATPDLSRSRGIQR